ncbi:Protein DCL, chloroplastic [Ananas comosus]|uniref:Protein DCL, chloroplastic n=1 Tax=Ananas comosus TaxID=4615 RepID=A0A199V5D8_ANACO|nr:Protein DCL, chloroplastic [Ananas comosus]
MASISLPSPHLLLHRLSLRSSSALTLAPFPSLPAPIASTLRSEGVVKVKSQGSPDPALLRKPLVSPPPTTTTAAAEAEEREIPGDGAADEVAVEGRRARGGRRRKSGGEEEEEEGKWVDWEDLILQDTVPLVGFVRMILHSGKYGSGDRFSPEHEKAIIERLLPYHPEYEKKIGCGIDYITIGFHPEFENSRCLFIVRKDGELIDFSYWKCIKGLIRKNYPLYADSFILRHFRRRRDY